MKHVSCLLYIKFCFLMLCSKIVLEIHLSQTPPMKPILKVTTNSVVFHSWKQAVPLSARYFLRCLKCKLGVNFHVGVGGAHFFRLKFYHIGTAVIIIRKCLYFKRKH